MYCLLLFLLFSGLFIKAQEEEYQYTPFPHSNAICNGIMNLPLEVKRLLLIMHLLYSMKIQ